MAFILKFMGVGDICWRDSYGDQSLISEAMLWLYAYNYPIIASISCSVFFFKLTLFSIP